MRNEGIRPGRRKIGSEPLRPQRNATLSVGTLLRSLYLLHFSQPASDRAVYRAVKTQPIRSIVEIGIGSGGRTQRLLEVAAWRAASLPLRYTGIDLFEARPAGSPGHSLKEAFALFQRPGVKVQLVPGEADVALRRVANALAGTELLLISAGLDAESLARAWTWLPRMLTAQSSVFLEEPAKAVATGWRKLTIADVQQRAGAASRALRRAA